LACRLERARRWAVEDAHRRTQAARLFALARRRQSPCGGLRKPYPPGFCSRQAGDAPAGGDCRAVIRPHPRPRRHAADLAARMREYPEALSGPCRRPQSRHSYAAADRGRNPERDAARSRAYLLFFYTEQAVVIILVAASPDGFAILAMAVLAEPA